MTPCFIPAIPAIPAKNLETINSKWVAQDQRTNSQKKADAFLFGAKKGTLDAVQAAEYCHQVFLALAELGNDEDLGNIEQFVEAQGVEMPKAKNKKLGVWPIKKRLEDVNWWSKKLRIKKTRHMEGVRIKGGLVRKYCSDDLLKEAQEKAERTKDWLQRTEVQHVDTDEAINLKTVHDNSLSNPKLRVNELSVRSKGVVEYYLGLGYRGIFVNITAPSCYHRFRTVKDEKGNKTKELNPKYNGATPKIVQKYFNKQYALTRTYLSNRGIQPVGIRVAEPHQDGCTHWHLVLWFKNGKEAKTAIQAFRKYFLFNKDADEKGAAKHRLTFDTVNPKRGDVVGYILTYITKGITGEFIDDHTDKNGEKIATGQEGALRVLAWARCWGIRQYQFLGSPPVGCYRELRRKYHKAMGRGKSQQVTVPTFDQFQQLQEFYKNNPIDDDILPIWAASNEGDFCGYVKEYQNVQGQQAVDFFKHYLIFACLLAAYFENCLWGLLGEFGLWGFEHVFISDKPSLLKHGFVDDLKELAKFYGNIKKVPDSVISKLESLNGYLEPKEMIFGVVIGKTKLITRNYDGYFRSIWRLVTKAKTEQKASVQERLETYASVRAKNGTGGQFWGDVVNFGASLGVFSKVEDRAAPRTCGNNCTGT